MIKNKFFKVICIILVTCEIVKLVILAIFFISTFSAIDHEDTTDIAKKEFSQYYNGDNEVALIISGEHVHLEENVLKFKDIDESFLYNSISFYNKRIYYLCLRSSNFGFTNDCIVFYSCDLLGETIQLEFSQSLNVNSKIKHAIFDTDYYLEYKKNDEKVIDKYNIVTKKYEIIAKGKDCKLANYLPEKEKSNFEYELIKEDKTNKHGSIIIRDLEKNEERIIDNSYLKNTNYYVSMIEYSYCVKRIDISNNHILLTYSIAAGDGWNNSHLTFEYDFENDSLEYKLLSFPYDNTPVEIVYIK